MKDPVRIFGCGRGFHLLIATAWRGRLLCEPCDCAGLITCWRRNDRALPGVALPQRYVMPIWMEILVNVLGYGGFLAIANFHKSSDDTDPSVTQGDRG